MSLVVWFRSFSVTGGLVQVLQCHWWSGSGSSVSLVVWFRFLSEDVCVVVFVLFTPRLTENCVRGQRCDLRGHPGLRQQGAAEGKVQRANHRFILSLANVICKDLNAKSRYTKSRYTVVS